MDISKNLSHLPFDNLYKFLSLAGLALLIISLIFPYKQYREAKRLSIEAEGEEAQLNVDLDVISNELKLIKQKLNVPDEYLSDYPGGLIGLACGRSQPPETIGKISCDEAKLVSSKHAENKRLLERINTRKAIVESLYNELWGLIVVALFGAVTGVGLMVTGFKLWYNRLQKYQDEIVKREASRNI